MSYSGSKFLGVLGMIAAGIFLVVILMMVNSRFSRNTLETLGTLVSVMIVMILLLMLITAQSLIRAAGNSEKLYELEQGQKALLNRLSETRSEPAKKQIQTPSAPKEETRQETPKKTGPASKIEEAYYQIADGFLIQEKERVIEAILNLPPEALSFKLSLDEQAKIQDQDLKAILTDSDLESRPVGNLVGWVKKLAFEYDLPEKACDLAQIAIRYNPVTGFIDSAVKLLLAAEAMNEG